MGQIDKETPIDKEKIRKATKNIFKFIYDVEFKSPDHLNGTLFYPYDMDKLFALVKDYQDMVINMYYEFNALLGKQASERTKKFLGLILDEKIIINPNKN